MFSAVGALISGQYLQGVLMFVEIVFISLFFVVFAKEKGKIPTNISIVSVILCAIVTDFLWMYMLFEGHDAGGFTRGVSNGLTRFAICAVVFYYGAGIMSVFKKKKYRGYKISALVVNTVCMALVFWEYFVFNVKNTFIIFSEAAPFVHEITALMVNLAAAFVLEYFILKGMRKTKLKIVCTVIFQALAILITATVIYNRVMLGWEYMNGKELAENVIVLF